MAALIEFLEPSEARKAFTKLAYTKFKHLPLYLEWAPDNSFTTDTTTIKEKQSLKAETKSSAIENKENGIKPQDPKVDEDIEDEDEPEPDTTLYVKNLNFSTTEESLKKVNFVVEMHGNEILKKLFFCSISKDAASFITRRSRQRKIPITRDKSCRWGTVLLDTN